MYEFEPVYMSSLDSQRFKPVRTCQFIHEVRFPTGKIAMLARLSPGISGQDFGVGDDLSHFILTTRFEGETINPISSFPCFVHIVLPSPEWDSASETISRTDLQNVAWGELYRTAEDAATHKFV